jgi:methionine sulfoxide reductase heme-binding subunit
MNWQPDQRQLALLKSALFLLCLLPFAYLLWTAHSDALSDEPEKFVQNWSGIWTITFLLLSLCITPFRAITGRHWLMRLRRMLGLFTFFYATLHFLSFIGFNHEFASAAIARDILKRPFIIIGFVAYVLLIPLAVTSNQWSIRQLGGRKWQELHRNVYLIGILGCIHYLWQATGAALLWPIACSLALITLLAWRIKERQRKAIPAPTIQTAKPLKFFRQRPK